jgi:hypothetical protein
MKDEHGGEARTGAPSLVQRPDQAPIVERPDLPRMVAPERPPVVRFREGANLMGKRLTADPGGLGRMKPMPRPARKVDESGPPPDKARRDQKPSPSAEEPAEAGYVRVRIHVENGALAIVGAKHVPGPLVVADTVGSGLAYEVLSAGRRIGLGSLPDANARRSFTNVDRPEAQLGHGSYTVEAFDFDARIPAELMTAEELPKLTITLYRLAQPPIQPLGLEPLTAQPELTGTLETIGQVDLAKVKPEIRTSLAQVAKSGPSAVFDAGDHIGPH